MTITVFSKPNCVQCRFTVRALDRAGLDHTVVDITENPDARDHVMALGYLSAPVVVVDETTHWSGFSDTRIAQLAAAAATSTIERRVG